MKMKTRPHPGNLIRTEIIEALGLSVTLAANALGVPDEKAFGPRMDHLLQMQLTYDIAQMRSHEHEIRVAPYVPTNDGPRSLHVTRR